MEELNQHLWHRMLLIMVKAVCRASEKLFSSHPLLSAAELIPSIHYIIEHMFLFVKGIAGRWGGDLDLATKAATEPRLPQMRVGGIGLGSLISACSGAAGWPDVLVGCSCVQGCMAHAVCAVSRL